MEVPYFCISALLLRMLLEELDDQRRGRLEACGLDDESAKALLRSPLLSHLKTLGMVNNKISDTARQQLIDRFGKGASI
jgi:hypothetical protein